MPERDTGGVPDLRERAGGALGGGLWPSGLGGAFSSTTGGASSLTGRLAGATLPLEEIVTLGVAGAGLPAGAFAAGAGAAVASLGAAGAAVTFVLTGSAGFLAAGAERTPAPAAGSAAGLAGADSASVFLGCGF